MSVDRLDELAMRRQELLLRSQQLRADLAADQRYVIEALSGLDRFASIAKNVSKPIALGAAALLMLSFMRRARPAAFAMRALVWVSMARRLLPIVGLVRTFMRSRQRPPPPESP